MRKKRAYRNKYGMGLLIIILMIFLILFIAGFGFLRLSGNAIGDTRVRVSVNDLGSRPEIIMVSEINPGILSEGTFKLFNFSFLVYARSGINSLPTSSADVSNKVEGKLMNKGVMRSSKDTNSRGCSYVETINNYYYNYQYIEVNNYSCSIAMWYFDEPGNWVINATISDSFSRNVSNQNTAWIQALDSWSANPGSLNWTNVILGAADQKASNVIRISNTGNTNVIGIKINASNLNGSSIAGQQILANWFASGVYPGSCNGNILNKSQQVSIGLLVNSSLSSISAPSSRDLEFCLKQIIGVSAQAYRSEADWELRVSYV